MFSPGVRSAHPMDYSRTLADERRHAPRSSAPGLKKSYTTQTQGSIFEHPDYVDIDDIIKDYEDFK